MKTQHQIAKDKIAQYGLKAMNDEELLTAIKFNGSTEDYYNSYEYKAAKELVSRRCTPSQRKITRSSDAAELMSFLNDESDEYFYIITLNRGANVIKTTFISKGHDYATIVGIKHLAGIAIQEKACSVILCHNHPSGTNRPSQEDINLTKKVSEALRLFDIVVSDHIIISRDNGFFSFNDEGLL